ncbi:GTP pyrophosphokinase rsh [bacterium BMS3Bbin11]|nr:GTP pyrophosphokinase rsh [bacterium BMS3Abin11]GBE45442.1 GTP pyrophosphokinase rsh [bacterium BMS3Bbin11]GMT41149.1 MAG: phosphohydrolase [bacterium]HDH08018.1 bifunctional (p)ppGpp synthetase/guanosine-3',5'-bis(diphosphate) 3'-pyrophosphohydrolase [Gammaproteobacteria bacterium]HDH15834.1 bifunctional (p)ppGpp synthetase/guanosine-3',5'-bis(diphosphate) 3'-pyrophosphohydrolase [Gammaproteobacteria bacterium]
MDTQSDLIKAVAFAADRHRDQRRKDVCASPYINHPIQLIDVLCNEAGISDTNVLCAAALHDTIEDTKTTAAELTQYFGQQICTIVLEMSDDCNLCKTERKKEQIRRAPELSDEAKLIKLADKICNLRDVADNPPVGWGLQRRQEYFDWAKAVIDGLRGIHPRLESIFDLTYAKRPE